MSNLKKIQAASEAAKARRIGETFKVKGKVFWEKPDTIKTKNGGTLSKMSLGVRLEEDVADKLITEMLENEDLKKNEKLVLVSVQNQGVLNFQEDGSYSLFANGLTSGKGAVQGLRRIAQNDVIEMEFVAKLGEFQNGEKALFKNIAKVTIVDDKGGENEISADDVTDDGGLV